MGDLWMPAGRAYISTMCPGNENQVDWSATATPQDDKVVEGVLPSLSRPKARPIPQTRHGVMNTLLGDNDLSAVDIGGSDPYNATGRQFRR